MRLQSKIIIFISFLMGSFACEAATDGTLSTSSTGTVQVSLTVPALVQITGLSDITLNSPTSYPATGNTSACIYSNVASPLGSYFVTVTSTNESSGNFRVFDGGINYIHYSAYWNNSASATQTTLLTSSTKTAQQSGGDSTSLSCGGSANANFNISFSAADITGAPAGTYTDTVTILVTPS